MNDPFQQNDSNLPENTPISLPPSPANKPDGFDRTLWYTIGGIVLFSCCGILLLGYLFSRSDPVKNIFAVPTYAYTPPPTLSGLPILNPGATQSSAAPRATRLPTKSTWVKPNQSPTLGTTSEAQSARTNNSVKGLKTFASYLPSVPDINQPGDLYFHGIRLDRSTLALWDYAWCSAKAETRDQNLDQMKVEFFVNEDSVSSSFLAVEDYQKSEKQFCRVYFVLVLSWPEGIHKLETKISFLDPVKNGARLYPVGTHTYQYLVTAKP